MHYYSGGPRPYLMTGWEDFSDRNVVVEVSDDEGTVLFVSKFVPLSAPVFVGDGRDRKLFALSTYMQCHRVQFELMDRVLTSLGFSAAAVLRFRTWTAKKLWDGWKT